MDWFFRVNCEDVFTTKDTTRRSRKRNSEYLPPRRKVRQVRICCHFDRREKSFLDPSPSLGMTGVGPSPLRLGAFAGDNPRTSGTPPGGFEPQGGARSAPYENYFDSFFAPFAFFAANSPIPVRSELLAGATARWWLYRSLTVRQGFVHCPSRNEPAI